MCEAGAATVPGPGPNAIAYYLFSLASAPIIAGAGKQLPAAMFSARNLSSNVSMSISSAVTMPIAIARGNNERNDSANHSK